MNISTKAETIGSLVSAIAALVNQSEELVQDAVDSLDGHEPDQARVNGAIGALMALEGKAQAVQDLIRAAQTVHRT